MVTAKTTIESLWTVANGWRIHSRVALQNAPANAPDVALIHGLVVSSTYMAPLAEALAPDYRVFAPDLPGFGESDRPAKALSVPELADALLQWMDSTGLVRPLLIGNSFGCQVAIDFATRYPDRTRGMVLVSPTVDPQAKNLPTQIVRWLRNSLREPPDLAPTLVKDFLKAGLVRSLRTMSIYVSDNVEQKLPKVPVPVLIVRGAHDPIVPDRWVKEAVRLLPDAKLSVIPGVRHTANYSAPLEIARMARIFDQHPRYVLTADGT